ncbi:DUF6387 family protein [Herbaspirillum sp. GCM10030257]|uniref:DUF6387 family protein n=1 Tax=Herbaspirillum sp. GCM10030257 TaxID=3273393 RepID=UPI00361E92C3
MDHFNWFDVSNYDQCKEWTAEEWYYAILWRNYLLVAVDEITSVFADEFLKLMIKTEPTEWPLAPELRTSLWSECIVNIHQDPRPQRKSPFMGSDTKYQYQAVRECDLSTLGAFANELINSRPTRESEVLFGNIWDEEFSNTVGNKTIDDLYTEKFGAVRDENIQLVLLVDLEAPDSVLIEQMLNLVHGRRALHRVDALPKVPDDVQLAKWHRSRILGYVDINLYKKILGVSLTDHQIGMLLFPNEYDISLSERIRKVIRPLATKVFRPETLSALEASHPTWRESSAIGSLGATNA